MHFLFFWFFMLFFPIGIEQKKNMQKPPWAEKSYFNAFIPHFFSNNSNKLHGPESELEQGAFVSPDHSEQVFREKHPTSAARLRVIPPASSLAPNSPGRSQCVLKERPRACIHALGQSITQRRDWERSPKPFQLIGGSRERHLQTQQVLLGLNGRAIKVHLQAGTT